MVLHVYEKVVMSEKVQAQERHTYVRDDEFPDEGTTRYSEGYDAGTKLCDLGSVGGGELDAAVVRWRLLFRRWLQGRPTKRLRC